MKPSGELLKQREIVFYHLPTDQAVQAARYLGRLPGVIAQAHPEKHSITVSYQITEHTLESLENGLLAAGFHLDGSIMQKIRRALAHYCEDVQRDNLDIPEHNIKTRDVYVKVWEHHPHGDHDDTPEELRRYL
ncbi:hypothetical protein [Chitinilyticum piscinae]|uniref:Uncharacterized protein n=1 Tax=Chitinilyticum piscinae TaxID=2866724 RepID=A0A8J7FLA8_9NEIS|nr:hypothetical protein [Chitinilyticum piscinae]MBE9609885.1 hypothetical protein [Chitinilyticum piscinae]